MLLTLRQFQEHESLSFKFRLILDVALVLEWLGKPHRELKDCLG